MSETSAQSNELTHLEQIQITFNALNERIAFLENQLNQSGTTSDNGSSLPKVALPEKYDGSMLKFRDFISSLENLFVLHAKRYKSDTIKIRFIGTLLIKDALSWFRSLVDDKSHLLDSYEEFMFEFRKIFDDPNAQRHAQSAMHRLKQGKSSVLNYISRFRRIAHESGFNSQALMDAFYRGLNDDIKDVLAMNEDVENLEFLMNLTIRIDNKLWDRKMEKSFKNTHGHNSYKNEKPNNSSSSTVPMDLDSMSQSSKFKKLTADEKNRRLTNKLCLYCADPGHQLSSCPKRSTN